MLDLLYRRVPPGIKFVRYADKGSLAPHELRSATPIVIGRGIDERLLGWFVSIQ